MNRTLEQIKQFNCIEYNHWQLMCDIANNDYDINYFSGRATINSNVKDFLEDLDNFDIDTIIDYLNTELVGENNTYNENYKGCIDELYLLINFITQEYV